MRAWYQYIYIYIHTHTPIYLSIYLSVYLSIYLCIFGLRFIHPFAYTIHRYAHNLRTSAQGTFKWIFPFYCLAPALLPREGTQFFETSAWLRGGSKKCTKPRAIPPVFTRDKVVVMTLGLNGSTEVVWITTGRNPGSASERPKAPARFVGNRQALYSRGHLEAHGP